MVLKSLMLGLMFLAQPPDADSLLHVEPVQAEVIVKPKKPVSQVTTSAADTLAPQPVSAPVATRSEQSVSSEVKQVVIEADTTSAGVEPASMDEPRSIVLPLLVLGLVAGGVFAFLLRRKSSNPEKPTESKSISVNVADEPVILKNEGISLEVGKMAVTVGQAQHLGMRRQQQDAFALSDVVASPFIAVLADGMGGMKNGAEASRTAIREFLAAMSAGSTPEAALKKANSEVYRIGVDGGEAEGTGTTLAAVLLSDARLSWISVGDSQIYLARDGELSFVNKEHSYLLDLYQDVIRDQIDLEKARLNPQKDALTSFVGLKTITLIDQSRTSIPLKPGDKLLICSDGLYRALSAEEILAILTSDRLNPADELVKQAMAKNHPYQDNTTVITLSIDRIL